MTEMKESYLLYEKHGTIGNCRFCGQRTSIMVYPPELKEQIQSPVYVCSLCRTTRWKMDELGKLFNRTVERIIHNKEVPIISISSQLRFQDGISIQHIEKSQILHHFEDWIAEPKMNGVRVMAYIQDQQVRFLTSRFPMKVGAYRDITDQLPHLQLAIPELEGTVLDGVLAPSAEFIVFDCLKYKSTDIRHMEFAVRQITLLHIFKSISHSLWGQIETWNLSTLDEMKEIFNSALDADFEGIMLKNLRSPYKGGRDKAWIMWEKTAMIGGNN